MAKYSGGILGPYFGKVGAVVGRKWKGIFYTAGYQKNVSNPRTTAQRKIRARFAKLSELGSLFLGTIVRGFNKVCGGVMTEFDMFIKLNWPNVTATSPDDVTIDYSSLQVAKGNCPGVVFGAVDYGEAHHLTVAATFSGNVGVDGASANDDVYLCAYCPDMDQCVLSSPAKRSTSSVSVAVPALWDGQEVYLYGFVVADGTTKHALGTASDSSYCGTGEIQ